MFQRLPGAFEEDALLRVEDLRLARREAEEAGVEPLGLLEDGATAHVLRVPAQRGGHASRLEVRVAESVEALDALDDVAPEGVEPVGARKAAGHADDGDRVRRHARSGTGLFLRSGARPLQGSAVRRYGRQPLGLRLHGGALEQFDQRQLGGELALQARLQLDQQQRVPAEVEEVVVQADALYAAGPRATASATRCSAGVINASLPSSDTAVMVGGAGSALRSTLPLGVSGSASSATKWLGIMYSGSLARSVARAASASNGMPSAHTT